MSWINLNTRDCLGIATFEFEIWNAALDFE